MPVEEGVTAEQDGKSGATQGKRAFYQSLTVKNLALFLPVFLLSLAPMSISYWLEIQESRINLLVAEMELVAELSLMKADVKTIFNMVESGLNESPEHEKVTGFLGEIEKKHNLSNAIILSRDGDGRYVVLADGKHLFSAGDPMWFHDRYPQIRQTAEESWISKRVSNTKLFSLSTYEYLQVFKPIEYDGNVVGMLLLNKLAEDIERAILADAIRLTGLSLLLAFMGGVGFWFFSNRMLAPLKRLKDAAIKLGEGDLDEVIPPIHRMDEVGELNESFRKMVDQVTESREVLSHNNEELLQALEKVQVMEYREKNLSRFVPDAVRKTLAEHPEQLDRGKEEKDVTVLFLDIEGSSKLAESMEPEKVDQLVENYFSRYLDFIYENQGDITETIGDGLMIIFQGNDPVQHAINAVRTAVSIQNATLALADKQDTPESKLRINIGINSGNAMVGFTRYESSLSGIRLTYTASGRTTIVSSRLQEMAKGGAVLMTWETWQRVQGHRSMKNARFHAKSLGEHKLKNINNPQLIYQIFPAPQHGMDVSKRREKMQIETLDLGHEKKSRSKKRKDA